MIINWRWSKFPKNDKFKLMLNKDDKKVIISRFDKTQKNDFNNFIKDQVDNYKPKYLLIFTHYNPENTGTQIQIDKSQITVNSNDKTTIKVRNIRGGNVSKELNFIYDSNEGMIKSDGADYNNQININNFDKVWHFYWDVIELEYQKKNIINLWLPLAIDIQGLSEVQNDTKKATEYFNNIKSETAYFESLKSFPNDDEFPQWKEIEVYLKKNEHTKSYADFKPNSIAEMFLKEENDFNSFKRNEANYLLKEKDGSPNPNFLPNWLQEVVKVIDNKLNTKG